MLLIRKTNSRKLRTGEERRGALTIITSRTMNKFSLGRALIISGCLSFLLAEPPSITEAQSPAGSNRTATVPPQTGPVQSGASPTNQARPRVRPRERFGRFGGGDPTPTLGLEQGFIQLDTPD